MKTLEEVRAMFPKANYAPDPTCERCGGEGVYDMPPEKAAKIKHLRTTGLPCMCIFVDPEFRKLAQDTLTEVCREGLEAIRRGGAS